MAAKDVFELLFFRSIVWTCTILPYPFCLIKGRILGQMFYFFDKKHRTIALSNLNNALGDELSDKNRQKIASRSFKHFGEFLFSLIKFSSWKEPKRNRSLEIEGEENLMNVLKEKKGALLFSAHYGNWEIAPFYLKTLSEMSVIARPLDNPRLEKALHKVRAGIGARVIPKKSASKQTLRALSKNEMVAVLIDQNVLKSQAVFVDFFGRKAATTPALAVFHLRSKAPLVPVFCYPVSFRRYKIKIMKPLEFQPTGDHDQDIQNITQACTTIIETQIRKRPEFWLWFHNRWKTQP